jgi:CheY-like chemotaxis protein
MELRATLTESARPTVDIYEHDPATRELMQMWLSEAGYRVRERSGSRAPANSPVDLVILATQVPTPQALGLIRIMRNLYPTTAFLVLADRPDGGPFSAEERSRTTARAAGGATRVLSKPLTREGLLEAARAARQWISIASDFN